MSPGDPLVTAANAVLADPNVRATIRQMHAEGAPLVKIVEALGLDDDMSARIRQVLEELPPDIVQGIRKAVLTMLDSGTYVMPLNCAMSKVELETGAPVDVTVSPDDGRPTIHVKVRASV